MKKLLVAALLAVSSAANAATYTFDFKFDEGGFPGAPASPIPSSWAGTGTLTVEEMTTAQASSSAANFANYSVAFAITLNGPDYHFDFSTNAGTGRVMLNTPDPNFDSLYLWEGALGSGLSFSADPYQADLPNTDLSASNLVAAANAHYSPLYSNTRIRLNDGTFRNAEVRNFALSITPAPEPGEWAMIGAGLAIVGGVARRRGERS